MHLEDQVNRMNKVVLDQGRQVDGIIEVIGRLSRRMKSLEDGGGGSGESPDFTGPSEMPPDGVNR